MPLSHNELNYVSLDQSGGHPAIDICQTISIELTLIPAWICIITSIIKLGVKLRIHSETSTGQPLKDGKW